MGVDRVRNLLYTKGQYMFFFSWNFREGLCIQIVAKPFYELLNVPKYLEHVNLPLFQRLAGDKYLQHLQA